VYPVSPEEKSEYLTISKCKTFTAPSADREFVYAKLLRNVESACIKLRRYHLRARALCVALRRQDFSQLGMEARLTRATSSPQEMVPLVHEMFDQLFEPGVEYRTTMVVMNELEDDRSDQIELFEDRVRIERMEAAARAIDEVAERYGKHKVGLGPALFLDRHARTFRDDRPERKSDLLAGETARQRLAFPKLAVEV
jgi:DNA polymerase IV